MDILHSLFFPFCLYSVFYFKFLEFSLIEICQDPKISRHSICDNTSDTQAIYIEVIFTNITI